MLAPMGQRLLKEIMKKPAEDRRTVEAIGQIYCKGNHGGAERDSGGLCAECREAIELTIRRAEACPHGHTGNCEDCHTHCQHGRAQENIKRMMRYSAPRMAYRHPVMTFRYLRRKFKRKQLPSQ